MSHKTKLRRIDWVKEAMRALQTEGIGGVRVQRLAKSLGVTRGGFYWHFKGRDDLLEAMLEYWETETTDSVIEHIDSFDGNAVERVRELARFIVRAKQSRFDPVVRAWALSSPMAADAVARSDRKRIGFVQGGFREAGFSPKEARARGAMLAIYLMGEAMILSGQSVDERLRMLDVQLDRLLERKQRAPTGKPV